MKKLILFTFCFLQTTICLAQTSEQTPPAPTPATEEVNSQPRRELTAQQKVEMQKEILKSIQNKAVNSNTSERRRLMDAMETIKKIQIRQRNMNLPDDQQITYEKPNVNVENRREFQKYMQKTYLQDMDTSAEAMAAKIPTSEEDQEQSPQTTAPEN